MQLDVSGEVWFWKGPAPWYFVSVPDAQSAEIAAVAAAVTYGWGVIPVTAHTGATTWQTSLFPRGGRYAVPLKAHVRRAERIELGDTVSLRLTLDL